MSDLETRIRDALRADEIGWDDLRQPTLRVAPRTPRRWPTVLATAAAVAVVATAASVIALTRGTGQTAAHPAYAGYTWRVTGITDRRGPVTDVALVPATIAFGDTEVSGSVGGGSIFGHYQPTSRGYQLSDVGVISNGLVRNNKKLRIGSDILSVFLRPAKNSLGQPASVAARVSGDKLVLHANRVTLRLSRVGPSRLSPMIDAIGYNWRVDALIDAHGRLTIPHRLTATLGFDSFGFLLARDTVNRLMAQIGLSGGGYVVRSRAQLLASPSGNRHVLRVTGNANDPTELRLKAAVDAMVVNHPAVTATVDGDTLTLHRGAITLILHRGVRLQGMVEQTGGAASGGATAAASSASKAPPPRSRGHSAPNSAVRHAHGSAGSHH